MPAIDRDGPFKVIIYYDDHEPSHVHIWHPSGVLVVNLHGPGGDPEPREIRGSLKGNDAKRAFRLVLENRDAYRGKWNEIHGADDDE